MRSQLNDCTTDVFRFFAWEIQLHALIVTHNKRLKYSLNVAAVRFIYASLPVCKCSANIIHYVEYKR